MSSSDASDPLSIVIFGASGDLTTHKLIPALYQLHVRDKLPASARIAGFSRTPFSHDQFRDRLKEAFRKSAKDFDDRRWIEFAARLFYVAGDASAPGGLDGLRGWLDKQEPDGKGRRLYYLSVAPSLYAGIAEELGKAGMASEKAGWRRLVIEKPFGRDLASARKLNRRLHDHFSEPQLFRIDHYLGKETVQNLLVFRFANSLFEPVWNHNFIDNVQITVAETVTVGKRAGYYDHAGVMRDMLQSHLMQVLTLVAMEPTAHFAADPLRNEKVKVLDAIPVPCPKGAARQVVCGQYQGYLQEPGVAPNSRTPTFAAVRLHIDNWRWQGVPFYLSSGKGLKQRYTEVVIQFRCPPHLMFPLPAEHVPQCNRLALTIQPHEGIRLFFQTKVPGKDGVQLSGADMKFFYKDAYAGVDLPDAYERLLQDAIHGDAALFMRSDEIERAWEIMDPLIAVSENPDAPRPEGYPVGVECPPCMQEFLKREGRSVLGPCHCQ